MERAVTGIVIWIFLRPCGDAAPGASNSPHTTMKSTPVIRRTIVIPSLSGLRDRNLGPQLVPQRAVDRREAGVFVNAIQVPRPRNRHGSHALDPPGTRA